MLGKTRRNIALIVLLVAAVGIPLVLVAIAQVREHQRLTDNPLLLTRENDIREACDRLLDHAMANRSNSDLALRKLKATMIKLRDGWQPFQVQGYYPNGYTSHHLLAEVWWSTCTAIRDQRSVNQYEVMTLVYETRPATPDSEWWHNYNSTLQHFGLEHLTRSEEDTIPDWP